MPGIGSRRGNGGRGNSGEEISGVAGENSGEGSRRKVSGAAGKNRREGSRMLGKENRYEKREDL